MKILFKPYTHGDGDKEENPLDDRRYDGSSKEYGSTPEKYKDWDESCFLYDNLIRDEDHIEVPDKPTHQALEKPTWFACPATESFRKSQYLLGRPLDGL